MSRPRRTPKKHPSRRRESLSRERIVGAALALVERDGLADFSTRKLGQDLGCEAMSIYHHFPSKAHLLDAMIDRVITDLGMPPPSIDPIERLRILAYAFRAMAHRYPKLFQLVALYRMNSEAGLQCLNNIIQIFRDAGFDVETAARLFRAFSYYIVGAALDETAGYAKGASSQTPVPDDEVRERFPRVAESGSYFKPQQFDATFAVGLDILLDGIRRRRDDRRP